MSHFTLLSRVSALAVMTVLTSCAALPRSGPNEGAIVSGATAHIGKGAQKVGIDYVLVDLDKSIMSYLERYEPASFEAGFGGGRGGAPDITIGRGDILQLSVFEAQAGGLFIPADAGARPGNYVTLPQQEVDRKGNIAVPYAGDVHVEGLTADVVRRQIEERLANRAIEPQVVVTVVESRSNLVSVIGDVNAPKKVEISQNGERVLDAIADAGGISTPSLETYITLLRGGREATVLYDTLVKTPKENIYLAPDDVLSVNRERRTYMVFGAASATGRINFDDANLTLGQALGEAGGLSDTQADPAQVFVYREESRDQLQRMGVDMTKFAGSDIPVIYRANLRDPSAYFAISKFAMRDRDIIYISNAKTYELTKFLDIINNVSTTNGGVPSDVLNARNAIRGF